MHSNNIPSYFKQRNRWLLWDSSSDTPRRPHWKGDFGISWNDSTDWVSFDVACQAAVEKESWGIGFVIQPNDPVYVVDIDGAMDSSGQYRDWLPSTDVLTDTYSEWSPSGAGIHMAVEGEPPDWWSDSDVDPDNHEGVDVLENKFCTFTGDKIEGSFDEPQEINLDNWLTRVYHNINGELPGETRNEAESPEFELDESGVEAALGHLNPDMTHEDWVRVGFAVHDWGPGSRGRALFERWSRQGSKYDGQAESQIDWIWNKASKGSGVTVGTLIHKATNEGWSVPSASIEVDEDSDWSAIRMLFEDEETARARRAAAQKLNGITSWMYVLESETLYVYDHDSGRFGRWGEERASALLVENLGEHYSRYHRDEIVDQVANQNQTHRRDLNASNETDPLLCASNGVINLRNGELLEHSPEYKFTRGLRWDHDRAEADPGPVLSFLDDITKREEDRDTILDHLAHGLMPGHPYRAFIMMYGPGSNGKSKLGKLLRLFVGEDNAASVELQDLTGDNDFATGALPGAFVNVGDDVSIGEIRDSSTLKSLTGGATMRANEKHEKQYDFRNEAAMFFSANEPPRIKESTDAISDRLYPIEMPYRFLNDDERDPDNPYHKPRDSDIVPKLVENEAAMQGLLMLAVEHAQDLIDSGGEYSMPETASERRKMYEAASDPIHRFAYEFLEPAGGDSMLLKDDVYAVYTRMCDDEDERTAAEETFKRQMTKQSIIDVETTRNRSLTPGDSRDGAWAYVQFVEKAVQYMPARLKQRYMDDPTNDEPDDDTVYNATSINRAAQTLTGYVTVTAKIAAVEELGDGDSPTVKAVLKDETGAIDFVTWDTEVQNRLQSLEEKYVALRNAEVSEYEGKRQLQHVEHVTTIEEIQAGVGHTRPRDPSDGQEQLAKADGDGLESTKQKVMKALQTKKKEAVTPAQIAGELSEDPDVVERALDRIARETTKVAATEDGYEVL